ncbi:hypothetical protein EDC01DRAFT_761377 [Geopyxis carbonaria]|nr:hypothetical protein EDC01DRAFT_761377 [Geopyxis carbonaria]
MSCSSQIFEECFEHIVSDEVPRDNGAKNDGRGGGGGGDRPTREGNTGTCNAATQTVPVNGLPTTLVNLNAEIDTPIFSAEDSVTIEPELDECLHTPLLNANTEIEDTPLSFDEEFVLVSKPSLTFGSVAELTLAHWVTCFDTGCTCYGLDGRPKCFALETYREVLEDDDNSSDDSGRGDVCLNDSWSGSAAEPLLPKDGRYSQDDTDFETATQLDNCKCSNDSEPVEQKPPARTICMSDSHGLCNSTAQAYLSQELQRALNEPICAAARNTTVAPAPPTQVAPARGPVIYAASGVDYPGEFHTLHRHSSMTQNTPAIIPHSETREDIEYYREDGPRPLDEDAIEDEEHKEVDYADEPSETAVEDETGLHYTPDDPYTEPELSSGESDMDDELDMVSAYSFKSYSSSSCLGKRARNTVQADVERHVRPKFGKQQLRVEPKVLGAPRTKTGKKPLKAKKAEKAEKLREKLETLGTEVTKADAKEAKALDKQLKKLGPQAPKKGKASLRQKLSQKWPKVAEAPLEPAE